MNVFYRYLNDLEFRASVFEEGRIQDNEELYEEETEEEDDNGNLD